MSYQARKILPVLDIKADDLHCTYFDGKTKVSCPHINIGAMAPEGMIRRYCNVFRTQLVVGSEPNAPTERCDDCLVAEANMRQLNEVAQMVRERLGRKEVA